jgi:excisionase family DNA binding protein
MAIQNLLTTSEAAEYLNLSKISLEKRRCQGQSPKFIRLGRSVRYRLQDLDAWLEESVRTSTSDTGKKAASR